MFRFLHYSFALCCELSTFKPLGRIGLSLPFLVLVFSLALSEKLKAQIFETFDSTQPKFRLWLSDAAARVLPLARSEAGIEALEVAHGNGTYAYLVYPIERTAIIDDLVGSIRIRSAQSGFKLGFRVVFPRSTDPATRDPFVEVVLGNPTEGAGSWSTSTVNNVVAHFEARQRFLRAKYGPNIDLRDPYIDAVVLSVYSIPGTTRMQLDDLQVEGMIPPTYTPSDDGVFQIGNPKRDLVTMPIQDQLLNLQTKVPRWIQYQGESLDYLQSLGFNAVIANRSNDPLLIEQSQRSGLAIVAPPPDLVPTESIAPEYQHVQAWLLGLALDQSHLDQTRARVSKLSRFPASLARPTIGEAMEMYGAYSRLSDWLAVPQPLPTRVRSAKESSELMRSDLRPMAGRSVPLTSIVTQMPANWIAQKAIAMKAARNPSLETSDYDWLQVRMQLYRSVMQGARGWIFRSGTPLDNGDLASMARSQSYAALNQEIELLSPWLRSGEASWQSLPIDSNQYTGASLSTPNSLLAIIVASGPLDQICSVSPAVSRIQVTLPMTGQVRNVFRITNGSLETLRPQETADGLVITIERPALVEQLVSAVDPKPIAYLREQLTKVAPGMVESRMEMTQQVVDLAQKSLGAQLIPESDPRWEEVREAQSLQRGAMQYLTRSNIPEAMRATDQSLASAQRVVRKAWEDAAAQLSSVQSSTLIASPLTLPLHYEFTRLLAGRSWQTISIPGVPIKSLSILAEAGWRVDRRMMDTVQSDVEVGPPGPDGNLTLSLTTQPMNKQPIPSGYAGAVLRVSSPTLEMPVGSMALIQGIVGIQSPANESQSGLLVCDSIGGETFGQLISSSDPSQYQWRRFELIRFVTDPQGVKIHFETRGQVQVVIAQLSAEMIVPNGSPDLPIRTVESGAPNSEGLPVSTGIPNQAGTVIRQP